MLNSPPNGASLRLVPVMVQVFFKYKDYKSLDYNGNPIVN